MIEHASARRAREIHHDVDRFLVGVAETAALAEALRRGLIAELAAAPDGLPMDQLEDRWSPSGVVGAGLVLDMLVGSGVLCRSGGGVCLTEVFERVVASYRDLLETKVELALLSAGDVAQHSAALFGDLPAFSDRSRTFGWFDYSTAADGSDDSVAATARWVRYLTALTAVEAPVLLDLVDLAGRSHLVDVGGNGGEFARLARERHPALEATVVDLDAVCRVGRRRLEELGGPSVDFVAGDAVEGPVPVSGDVVALKSVLHDWDDPRARRLLGNAVAALEPGGLLLVAERSRFQIPRSPLRAADLTTMLFSVAVSGPQRYVRMLADLPLTDVTLDEVELDVPWFVLTARKPEDPTDHR